MFTMVVNIAAASESMLVDFAAVRPSRRDFNRRLGV